MKPVSIIIPTYNGRHLLEKNLPAVVECAHAEDEIVIVDDASTDGTTEWLEEMIAQIGVPVRFTLITNETNLRFGESVNYGVRAARHEQVLLLNNDVSPEPDVLQHLLPHFEDETVFAVGCAEVEDDGHTIVAGKNKLWFERGLFMHAKADDFTFGETGWASGGSALFDRRKWTQLGGFDKDYRPAYWEDVDLSYRAKKKGWKVLFEPKARVHHNHESTNNDVFGQRSIAAMSWRNAHKFVWKNGSLWQKASHLLWKPYWLLRK